MQVPARRTLSDMLRFDLGLTGLKIGCGKGECGACTVLLDGEPVCACLVMAGQVMGREIVTIEGVGERPTGRRVQEAFVAHGAVQCGFCIPGMIMSATALLEHHPAPSREQVVAGLSGNLCRCTGYTRIVEAVEACAEDQSETPSPS
ncbi:MAG: (2Fe-2S)-binding protein [Candidatus Sumerlaeia bacterium]